MTTDLYTATDVKKVKEQLYKEQLNRCALTGVVVDIKDCHTDHAHDEEQLVRGALHKQANMGLGKLEGLWTRYLAYWYPGTLSDFLRQAADYIDKPKDTRWRHPGWVKKVSTAFNKLKESDKDRVLIALDQPKGSNAKQRKELFRKAVLSRKFGYEYLSLIIKQTGKEDDERT
jgi:hypothetical protein